MRGRSRRSSNRIWIGLAVIGLAGIGGLAAGLNARAGLGQAPSMAVVDMPAADVVSLRFPADWAESAPAEPAPRMLAYASADPGMALFNPNPTYALADATSSIVKSPTVEAPAETAKVSVPVAEAPAKPKPAEGESEDEEAAVEEEAA